MCFAVVCGPREKCSSVLLEGLEQCECPRTGPVELVRLELHRKTRNKDELYTYKNGSCLCFVVGAGVGLPGERYITGIRWSGSFMYSHHVTRNSEGNIMRTRLIGIPRKWFSLYPEALSIAIHVR